MTAGQSTSVVSYEEQLRKEREELADTLPESSANKIKTKGKLFTLPGGASSPGPLNCVVLDYIPYNEYYSGVYNPKQPQAPVCWALNKKIKELVPSKHAPQKQAASCDTCPKGQWGSAPSGSGKACKNQFRLVIVPADFDANSDPLTIYVSPGAMKNWTKYVKTLSDQHQLLPVQVITSMSFDANQTYPSLLFEMVKPHGELALAMALRNRAEELLYREPKSDETKVAA